MPVMIHLEGVMSLISMFSWTQRPVYPEYNIMVADDLVIYGARASAVMVFTQSSQNNLVSALKGLTYPCLNQMDNILQMIFLNVFLNNIFKGTAHS